MNRLPAWIGWPGTGPAPGHDWLPGPKLRFIILGLTYAFLALALTVNYAYSTAFLLLAIIGLYVGLRRGFVNGLTRMERLVMLAFAACVGVSIASFLLGEQTRVGFRFIGRDLRFLLFIPIYLAIRWARPKVEHVGWALTGAAIGACIMAILQNKPWPAPIPQGVAGTHITFGDLSLLSGFLAAAILIPGDSGYAFGTRYRVARWVGASLALCAGLAASVLSGARGGWLAVPMLAVLFLWMSPPARRAKWSVRLAATVLALLVILAGAYSATRVRHRIELARQALTSYIVVANARTIDAPCVDRKEFLRVLLQNSHVEGPGAVKIVRLSSSDHREVSHWGCTGAYALLIANPDASSQTLKLKLYRGNRPARQKRQSATILARGEGSFSVGWKGPWVRIKALDSWRRYSTTQSYDQVSTANVHVLPGKHVWVIPMQRPHGVFAYALAESSVGQRLEMWRAAWALFLKHPWLGSGTGSFRAMGERALGGSAAARIAGGYEHAHSDYLTSLGTKGILGFLALIGLLLAPCFAIAGFRRSNSGTVPALAGAVLATGFGIFALTETLFIHSLVISWYAVASAALLTAGLVNRRAAPQVPIPGSDVS